jgi:pimeloyl-ACP methyl ester carboxylesterase
VSAEQTAGVPMNAAAATIAERYAYLLDDEFADVPGERERLGLAVDSPAAVERDEFALNAAHVVSFLAWGAPPPRYLLLHGSGLNAHSWDAVALGLGASSIVADLPGHGHSAWWDDFDYRPHRLAKAMRGLLEHAAPDPVHVVGQSLGGLTAIELARITPERVRSITIVDITPGRRSDKDASRRIRDFISGAQAYNTYEELVDHAVRTGIGSGRAGLERGIIHNTRMREDGKVVFRHHLASPPPQGQAPYDPTPLWDTIAALPVPVQLVHGTTGIVDEDQIAELRHRRPDARVVTLDAGHNVQRDAPRALADAIAAFAEENDS